MSDSMPRMREPANATGSLQFPWKLHRLLNEASTKDFESIISWIRRGTAFCVYDKSAFEKQVMPRYFSSNKYKSFQRNLSLWGFTQVRHGEGREKGGYCHQHFLQGQPNLCCMMTRLPIKSSSSAAKRESNHQIPEQKRTDDSPAGAILSNTMMASHQGSALTMPSLKLASTPVSTPASTPASAPASPNDTNVLRHQEATISGAFPMKLHRVLSMQNEASFPVHIAWMAHGRSFTILDPAAFVSNTLPRFFGHGDYTQFLRDLADFGFICISQGPNQGSFYHEMLIRGFPHLLRYMSTWEQSRKWTPDIANDPLFSFQTGGPSEKRLHPQNAEVAIDPSSLQQFQARMSNSTTLNLLANALRQTPTTDPTSNRGQSQIDSSERSAGHFQTSSGLMETMSNSTANNNMPATVSSNQSEQSAAGRSISGQSNFALNSGGLPQQVVMELIRLM